MDTRYNRRFVRDGNETAIFLCVISETTDSISGFYRKLASFCEAWCEENLSSVEKYRDRGYRTARYRFEAKECTRTDKSVGVEMRVKVWQGSGEAQTLFEEIHMWSISEGVILPYKKIKKSGKKA